MPIGIDGFILERNLFAASTPLMFIPVKLFTAEDCLLNFVIAYILRILLTIYLFIGYSFIIFFIINLLFIYYLSQLQIATDLLNF